MKFILLSITTILFTFIFGILYSFINKQNGKIIQRTCGWTIFCLLCSIGTIIHELSHLVFALIFLHKPTKIELFRPVKGKIDGRLGFVEHTYKKTRYRTAGNFFIGAAPMICGSIIIIILLNMIGINDFNINTLFNQIKNINFKNPLILIGIYSIFSITINMDMSSADMKNSLSGIISFLVLTILVYFVSNYFGFSLYDKYLLFVNNYFYILLFGLIMCLISLFVNFCISIIMKIFK